jgi:hypothetical protein
MVIAYGHQQPPPGPLSAFDPPLLKMSQVRAVIITVLYVQYQKKIMCRRIPRNKGNSFLLVCLVIIKILVTAVSVIIVIFVIVVII